MVHLQQAKVTLLGILSLTVIKVCHQVDLQRSVQGALHQKQCVSKDRCCWEPDSPFVAFVELSCAWARKATASLEFAYCCRAPPGRGKCLHDKHVVMLACDQASDKASLTIVALDQASLKASLTTVAFDQTPKRVVLTLSSKLEQTRDLWGLSSHFFCVLFFCFPVLFFSFCFKLTVMASGWPVCMAMRTRSPLNMTSSPSTDGGLCCSLASCWLSSCAGQGSVSSLCWHSRAHEIASMGSWKAIVNASPSVDTCHDIF